MISVPNLSEIQRLSFLWTAEIWTWLGIKAAPMLKFVPAVIRK
jgi:hypothetical protein